MNKIDKIKELLPLLDQEDDAILIYLLNEITTKVKIDYLSKYSVTPKEINKAKMGLRATIKPFLLSQDTKYKKINKILKDSDCGSCKFSKTIFLLKIKSQI